MKGTHFQLLLKRHKRIIFIQIRQPQGSTYRTCMSAFTARPEQEVDYSSAPLAGSAAKNMTLIPLKKDSTNYLKAKEMPNKVNTLYSLLIAITLLFSGDIIADNDSQKQKNVYKVDFNNPETPGKAFNQSQNKNNTTDTGDPELKILFFDQGHALVLQPGSMKNARLEYGNTDNSLQTKVTELEDQGVKYIICTAPVGNTKSSSNNLYNTNISNTTSAAELARLRAMGYQCAEPH
jgi:intracellular sulfur oxidation DsrE/DsrF family protein